MPDSIAMELGHVLLIAWVMLAALQPLLALLFPDHRHSLLHGSSRVMAMLGSFSMLWLVGLFVVSDFSYQLVAQHSYLSKPLLFKISGSWGQHEGSMLLWLTLIALVGGIFSLRYANCLPGAYTMHVLLIHAVIQAALGGYLLFLSNPFVRVVPPLFDGTGLNPLLQDVGLAMHPPMLYAAYAVMALLFSMGCAWAVVGRRLPETPPFHALWQRWAMLAFGILSFGIGLGSWWAYRELGWGGWWFWDPVENISFIPWLGLLLLLHALRVWHVRGQMPRLALWCMVGCFWLSVFGTFLVRSGLLTSVHSFASAPGRGLAMLAILTAFSVIVAWAYASFPKLLWNRHRQQPLALLSRDMAMIWQEALGITALVMVLFGLLSPLLAPVFGVVGVSIHYQFYNQLFLPVALLAAVMAAAAPLMGWPKERLKPWLLRLLPSLLGATLLLLALVFAYWPDGATRQLIPGDWRVLALWAAGAWLISGAFCYIAYHAQHERHYWHSNRLWRDFSMQAAHAGFGVLLIGIACSGLLDRHQQVLMEPKESIVFDTYTGRYQVTYHGPVAQDAGDYRGIAVHLSIQNPEGEEGEIFPEKRYYPVQNVTTHEMDGLQDKGSELQAILGDVAVNGKIQLTVHHIPGILWVWAGFFLIACGGAVGFLRRS